jgi:hypothetical protein
MVALTNSGWDGHAELLDLVAARYGTLERAVLECSAFPPASLVERTQGKAIVNAVRCGSFGELGQRERRTYISPTEAKERWGLDADDLGAVGVYVDDNHAAHVAFHACFGINWKQGSNTELCHVFDKEYSKDPRYFTALPNLVLVPTWLAKLTDSHRGVMQFLRWASRFVFGFCPGAACDRAPTGEGCPLCANPGCDIDMSYVQSKILAWDALAVQDYDAVLINRRDAVWAAARRAARGYSHTYLVPPPSGI